MYINSSDGRSYCRLAAYLRSSPTVGLGTFNPDYAMVYAGDNMFVFDGPEEAPGIISGWLPTADCLGIPRSDFEVSYQNVFRVQKPQQIEYDWRADERNYYATGSTFFSGFPDRTFASENGVSHTRYNGDISDLNSGYTSYYNSERLFTYSTMPTLGYSGLPVSRWYGAKRIGTNLAGFGTFELVQGSPYSAAPPTFGLRNQLDSFTAAMQLNGSVSFWLHDLYFGIWDNFVDNSSIGEGLNEQILDIEYDFHLSWNHIHELGEPGSYASFHVHKLVYFSFRSSYGTAEPNVANFPPLTVLRIDDESTVSVISSNIRYGGDASVDTIPRVSVASMSIAGSLVQPDSSSIPNFVTYRFSDKDYLNRRTDLYQKTVFNNFRDIRPSSFLSSSDALTKHLEALSSNNVENLQQLSDVLGLLPDVSGIAELVHKVARGDITAIKKLFDLISDAILRYKFAQKPTANDLQEIVGTDIDAFLKRLARTHRATITGQFDWRFPESQNFMGDGDLVLETKSKIRISSDISTLVQSCLLANSVGLLPSLARVWETLPLSFVVDWFTNMSSRLKLVDNQLLYMAFRTDWCLHSYKVIYYPSAEELARYNLYSPSSRKPFSISVYLREKSVYMPRLRESSYDFLAVTHGPSLVTAGALAFQAI